MTWTTVFHVLLLGVLAFWLLEKAAAFFDRFDRRPACAHCGRKDRQCAEVSWSRTVVDDTGRPAMQARASWMVCGRHADRPFPEGFNNLMTWCDALEARTPTPTGGVDV